MTHTEAFDAYCKTLNPLWNTVTSRTYAEQFFYAGFEAAQPAPVQQEVIDSNEKAAAYMEARLWECIDMAAAWPKARADQRIWDHVMVYAPKPAQHVTDGQVEAAHKIQEQQQ